MWGTWCQSRSFAPLTKRAGKKARLSRSSSGNQASSPLLPPAPALGYFRLLDLSWVLWVPAPFRSLLHQGIPPTTTTMTLPWLIRVPDPLQGAYPTSAPLRHPRNRMQTHGFSSPEKGAACPTPEMKRKAGNWPFSWNFSSCYFPGEKKRFWSNLGFFLLQIRTIDQFPEWSYLDSAPFRKALPQRFCHMILFCIHRLPQPSLGYWSLVSSLTDCIFITLPYAPHTHFCLFLWP